MTRLKTTVTTTLVASLVATVSAGAPPAATAALGPAAAPAPDAVVEWNRTLLAIVRTKTPQPVQPPTINATRAFAMLHLGIYDAVVAASGGRPYLRERILQRPASASAAADQAAHDVLAALYPTQKAALDGELSADLAAIPVGPRRVRGIRAGQSAANAIIADRAHDGSGSTPPAYVLPPGPGVFEPVPPATAVFTHWAAVRPFLLRRAGQFRPPPPAPLDSSAYVQAVRQVQSLGRSNSTTRTPEQTTIATFWSGNIWDYWNEIAESASLAHRDSLAQDARLFAELNAVFADTVIAFYDAKYTYDVWRPITAIVSGFPGFAAEPGWTSLGKTPGDPSYPGAHAAVSQAGATVLQSFFGRGAQALAVGSEVMPGTVRRFDGYAAAAAEASASRVFAGVHTQLDEDAGQRLGAHVARFILHSEPFASNTAPTQHPGGARAQRGSGRG
jgi:hypothetical protein